MPMPRPIVPTPPGPRPSRGARRLAVAAALLMAGVPAVSTAPAHPAHAQPPAAQPGAGVATLYLPRADKQWIAETVSLGDPYAPGRGNPGYDVIAYDLTFDVVVETPESGTPRARYLAVALIDAEVTAERLDRVSFDFGVPDVRGASINEAEVPWYSGAGNKLWLVPPKPLQRGDPLLVAVSYDGATGAGGGFNIQRASSQTAQVWTPLRNPGAWFPANDHPSDRARVKLRVTLVDSPGYVAVSSGTSDPGRPGGTRFDFHGHMAPGDLMLNIAPYTVVEDRAPGGAKFQYYTLRPAEQSAVLRGALARQLDFFQSRLHAPHGHEGPIKVVESGMNGTASLPELLAIGRNQLTQRRVTYERQFASLMAAQWLGPFIGFAGRRDDLLGSGLTTYLGILYQARDQGPEPVQARMAALESSFAFTVPRDLPLDGLPADGSGTAVAANKAPWAFHRLRLALGDDAFWAKLQHFVEMSEVTSPQSGSDVLDFLEAVVKNNLREDDPVAVAFDAAFRAADTPRVNLAWRQAPDGNLVEVRVCQLTPTPQVFRLPLALHGADRRMDFGIDVAQPDQAFEASFPARLRAITPDPAQVLLADVVVHPMGGDALPPCAALPAPALARDDGAAPPHGVPPDAGPADAATTTDAAAALSGHGLLDDPWVDTAAVDGRAEHRVDPAACAARWEDCLRGMHRPGAGARPHAPGLPGPAALDAPGEPSIGDPYLSYLGNTGYDVQRYVVKARVDPLAGRVEADTTIEARVTLDGLDRLSLDFMRPKDGKGLAIFTVTADGQPATYTRPDDADKLWIDLPAAKAAGDALTLRLTYGGAPVPGGADIFSGGLLPHGSDTMYAISEPDGTRNWIPSNDHPRDKALFRFEITAPKPFVATANGVPVETIDGAGETTAVFEMRQPMATYLATTAVGRYRTADQAGPGGVAIRHYFLNDPADGMRVAGVTPDILGVIGRLVAPYPFDTYGHYAAPDFGGGMENQSMTAIGPGAFASSTPRSQHGLIAHEAAHQWFGDAVSPYTWSDIWLNEGFATYYAELWRASRVGPEPLGWRMEALRYAVLSRALDLPVTQPLLADMFGTNTYEKGGWVLHMLRATLGDAAYTAGVRAYYDAHRFGNATTADLQAALQTASGQDLEPFFAQWLRRGGNPSLDVRWRQVGDTVTVRVCQAGPPVGPAVFDVPVVVAVHGAGRSVRAAGRADAPVATLTAVVPFTAEGVTVDPDFALLADILVTRAATEADMGCGL